MDDDRTPVQRLDDAIHDFVAATGREGTVDGWALAYSTSRLQTENPDALPLAHGYGYSIGPATSPLAAVGLGRYVAGIAERALLDNTDDDE